MKINHNIPHQYWHVDLSFMGVKETRKCIVHAIQSYGGKALLFHVLTDFGAHLSRVPLNFLSHKLTTDEHLPLHMLQLWDCFSDNVSFVQFDYLTEARVKATLKDRSLIWGNYFGTVDWYENGFTEEPTQFKQGHIILLDNGQIAMQPNNRLQFFDMSFTGKSFPMHKLRVIEETPSVESVSEKWLITGDEYFYEQVPNEPELSDSESEGNDS